MLKPRLSLIVLISIICFPISATIEDNGDIEITSETIEFNEKSNTIEYAKNVVTTKGKKTIKSDNLKIIRNNDGKIKKIIATGSPCIANINGEFMNIDEIKSNKIEVDPSKNLVRFIKNVVVIKETNTLYTDELECNMIEKSCKAMSKSNNGTKLIITTNEART